jgi:hypothetical protein
VQTTSNRVVWTMSIKEAFSHVPVARMITRFVCCSVDSEYVFWYIDVLRLCSCSRFYHTHPTYCQNPS